MKGRVSKSLRRAMVDLVLGKKVEGFITKNVFLPSDTLFPLTDKDEPALGVRFDMLEIGYHDKKLDITLRCEGQEIGTWEISVDLEAAFDHGGTLTVQPNRKDFFMATKVQLP